MKHIGLFEGIGGFSLAARWMGWETVAWCEWNPVCQRVLKYHFPEAEAYGDITKTDFTKYADQIDILTGGFPCQPYSLAGKRKGKDDERHLWPQMLRAIREIRPRWVVGENVFGLINWDGGVVFHEVQTDLEAAGYEVWPYVLPACAVNAPHRRDRVWFVAYAKSQRNRCEQEFDRGKWVQQNSCGRQGVGEQHSNISSDAIATHPNTQQRECTQGGFQPEFVNGGAENTIAHSVSGTAGSSGASSGTESSRGNHYPQPEEGRTTPEQHTRCGDVCGANTHPHSNGCQRCNCQHEKYTSEGREYAQHDTKQIATENPNGDGWGSNEWQEPSGNGQFGNIGTGDYERLCADNGEVGAVSNANSKRWEQLNTSEKPNKQNIVSGGCATDAAHTTQQQYYGNDRNQCRTARPQQGEFGGKIIADNFSESVTNPTSGRGVQDNEEYASRQSEQNISSWRNFPTQSPLCSRDDGLSDRLVDITFSRWRAEAIKAYGNAIVPQVVLQVYKAIEAFENAIK